MAMKIEKLTANKKTNQVVFMLKDASDVFANTVRRLILEEVPTLAVETVQIKDNSSALYDEMLALRLGLLPIKTDVKSYRLPESEEEVTEKSARCTLQITLKAGKNGYVYAGDAESADPKCTFVYPQTPIVKLLPKQKVDVTMTAVMGQGKIHAKWAPGWAFYRREPVVTIGKVKDAQLVADNCTDGVFTLKAGTLSLNQDKVYQSHLIEYYAELDEGITVEYGDNIIFTLESWGQLTHQEMLTSSMDILVQKVEELESQI